MAPYGDLRFSVLLFIIPHGGGRGGFVTLHRFVAALIAATSTCPSSGF
jgi:hypothetical protein